MLKPDLAPWACHPTQTRGRRVAQPPAPPRNDHQRDRDRIVHSTAFRRLVYKTQVFINHEGDLFRTRLTHSLEVAQLSRAAARALGLNEDLAEAIALAHDLGHTPFGHAGQDALHSCMQGHGGFEHNLQSLRVVDLLEHQYPLFDGLNLSFETREGVLKHCSQHHARQLCEREPQGPAWRFLNNGQASLEAQVVDVCDEIAYSAHDVDDGMRSGLLNWQQLQSVPLMQQLREQVLADHPSLAHNSDRRLLAECLRRMISRDMADLITTTALALKRAAPDTVDALRRMPPLAALSAGLKEQRRVLKGFLFQSLYRHPQVVAMTDVAKTIVTELFEHYTSKPQQLPPEHRHLHPTPSPQHEAPDPQPGAFQASPHRAAADYIAGMTDRFATQEHSRLTGQRLFEAR